MSNKYGVIDTLNEIEENLTKNAYYENQVLHIELEFVLSKLNELRYELLALPLEPALPPTPPEGE